MSDYTPSLCTIRSAYKNRKPGSSYLIWASQPHVETTADAEFDRAIEQVRAEAKAEALQELLTNETLEWARKRVEDELVEWRDAGLSELGRNNGLTIKHRDGTPSHVIRFGFESGWRICITDKIKEMTS